MEPLFLKPAAKYNLWGGTRLKREFHKEFHIDRLGETWECSTHPDGQSIITNGAFKGLALGEVLQENPKFLGERVNQAEGLPIMLKLIDAEKDLSVQVHPSDEYALIHENQRGKTEMWYIVDAKPGASIIYGFNNNVTRSQLERAVKNGTIMKHMQRIPVKKDEAYYLPCGTIHAIGAGILVAEVQECSNVTYRLYDYDRIDKDGRKRELHIEKALDVVSMKPAFSAKPLPRTMHYYRGCVREIICRCKYFETERIIVKYDFEFSVLDRSFQIILCLDGEGVLTTRITCDKVKKGQCVFLPAGLGRCSLEGNLKLLKVRV